MGTLRGKYKVKQENIVKLKKYINKNYDKYKHILKENNNGK